MIQADSPLIYQLASGICNFSQHYRGKGAGELLGSLLFFGCDRGSLSSLRGSGMAQV